jgi:hypothetical protein
VRRKGTKKEMESKRERRIRNRFEKKRNQEAKRAFRAAKKDEPEGFDWSEMLYGISSIFDTMCTTV